MANINGQVAVVSISDIDGTRPYVGRNGIHGKTLTTSGAQTIYGTMSFTGQLRVDDGTEAAPSIARVGDTNTGIYFPVDNSIAFVRAGAEKMRIDPNGILLLGSAIKVSHENAQSKFQINTNGSYGDQNISQSVWAASTISPAIAQGKSRSVEVGNSSGGELKNGDRLGRWIVSGDDGTGLKTSGYIDFNVTSDVVSGSGVIPSKLMIALTDDSTSPVNALTVGSRQVMIRDGSVGEPSLTFINDTNTGLYSPTNDVLSVAVSGTEILRANVNGISAYSNGSIRKVLTNPDVQLISSGASLTPSFSVDCYDIALTESLTISSPTNLVNGKTLTLRIKQAVGNSYDCLFDPAYKWDSTAPDISAASNTSTLVSITNINSTLFSSYKTYSGI